MDSIFTGHAQDVDNKHSQVIADCLQNAIVVRKILENFPNPELLSLSFVNKLWNYEARSVMKKRGSTIASLGRSGLCDDIQAFAASLRQINIVPFSGMRILFPANDDSCPCATSVLCPTHDIIFDPLPFKTLSVQLVRKRWDDNRNCRGFLLARTFMQGLAVVIEQLSLQICCNPQSLIQHNFQECSFPRLKILKLEETHQCSFTNQDCIKYFKVFMSRAPNLRELHSDGSIRELLALVKGSAVVPVCSDKVIVAFDEIPYDVIAGLLKVRLQAMEVVCTNGCSFNFERFRRIFPVLLQAPCSSTLSELTVDAVIAASLMLYGVRLESLRKFTMGFRLDRLDFVDHRIISGLLAHFNFSRIFPKLSEVHISCRPFLKDVPEGMKTILRQVNINLRKPMPDRAVNIKELHLDCRAFAGNSVKYFALMFPNIERLYVANLMGAAGFVLGSICQHWIKLRELHIKANYLADTANFDDIFCGIFFDEATQLMQKDEDYLKRVHIVPVTPAVICLRHLRVLHLEYNLHRRPEPIIGNVTNPTFFLSKVAGLIALATCPNLAVTLKISPDGAQAVNHLKPYFSIVQ